MTNTETSYVVYGGKNLTNIDFAALNNTQGFALYGAAGDYSGWSVSSAGDVNKDGHDDIVVGAPGYYGITPSNSPGSSYVVYWNNMTVPTTTSTTTSSTTSTTTTKTTTTATTTTAIYESNNLSLTVGSW